MAYGQAKVQIYNNHPLFFVYHSMGAAYDKLPATVLALVILFASMKVTILLELLRPTFRTHVAHAHGHLLPSLLSVRDTDYSCRGA